MTLSEELTWRGQVKDKTFADIKWLDTPKTFYLGADCSADSLQIGNLAVFMLAKRLNAAGWKTVLLVGGATSMIGDPGGKEAERELKTREEIQYNVDGIKQQVKKLFGDGDFELVDNFDWFKDINFLEFLRDVGKHYSMTELLQRDFIAERLGQEGSGISFAEFSYTLIQGYDFWHLYQKHGVVLQIGGSDQWGNMLSGVPLIRKKENQEVHAMSMPLVIDKATGKKFGKSEGGAVWLDSSKTTPTQFYQFWINCDDNGVEDYLKIYTNKDPETLERLMQTHRDSPQLRSAQRELAYDVTVIVHGDKQAQLAQKVTDYLTGKSDLASADPEIIDGLRHEVSSVLTSVSGSVVDALVNSGLAASNSDARRLLAANAVSVNGQKISRDSFEARDFVNGRLLLKRGKAFKDSALVEIA